MYEQMFYLGKVGTSLKLVNRALLAERLFTIGQKLCQKEYTDEWAVDVLINGEEEQPIPVPKNDTDAWQKWAARVAAIVIPEDGIYRRRLEYELAGIPCNPKKS